MPEIVCSSAVPGDLVAAKRLLAECGLPNADVDKHFSQFTIARNGSRVAGVAGLESAGATGLLRSLAVAADERNQGIGEALCEAVFAGARKKGMTRLYLLTTDAPAYFERFDFFVVARDDAPPEIQATDQFSVLCPSTSILMVKEL